MNSHQNFFNVLRALSNATFGPGKKLHYSNFAVTKFFPKCDILDNYFITPIFWLIILSLQFFGYFSSKFALNEMNNPNPQKTH
jgi:hypothetical protein